MHLLSLLLLLHEVNINRKFLKPNKRKANQERLLGLDPFQLSSDNIVHTSIYLKKS